jgi:integrase
MARPATGQVVERKGKGGTTLALRFRAYGERRYVTLGSREDGWTRQRAEDELQDTLAAVRLGSWQEPRPEPEEPTPEPTFHEFASEWLEARSHELRPRTVEDYRWALTHHLLPFFYRHRLSQITIEEVDRYRAAKLREGRLSPVIVNKTLTRLAQVLENAVEYGHLPANPAKGRRRRAKVDRPRRTWLEPEQVQPLVNAASVRGQRGGKTSPDPRMRTLVATAICTGLQVEELLFLRWRDVDLPGRRLTVSGAKTDAGIREVDLWPELADELATYRAGLPATPPPAAFVFGTSSGKTDTRSNVAKRLRRAVERANRALEAEGQASIPDGLTAHSLRRTFASLLYLRGENPVYVMDQLGHSDPKLALRIYAKVVARHRHGQRLEGVLRGVQWARTGTNLPLVGSPGLDPTLPQHEKTPQ